MTKFALLTNLLWHLYHLKKIYIYYVLPQGKEDAASLILYNDHDVDIYFKKLLPLKDYVASYSVHRVCMHVRFNIKMQLKKYSGIKHW